MIYGWCLWFIVWYLGLWVGVYKFGLDICGVCCVLMFVWCFIVVDVFMRCHSSYYHVIVVSYRYIHPSSTYRPHVVHISSTFVDMSSTTSTFRPHVVHISSTYRPHFVHMSSTYRPHVVSSTRRPHVVHVVHMSCRPRVVNPKSYTIDPKHPIPTPYTLKP